MVDNQYGIEPEEYADLETNYPQLDKNTSSGQSPKNPFDGGGGGADFFVVNVTKTGSGESATYSADKTITQIVDAYNEGKSIYAIYPVSNTNKKVIPFVKLVTGTYPRATFCNVESSASSGTGTVVVAPRVDAITIDRDSVTLYRDFDLLTKEMEVRTIDSESTNYRYPTAKAVYDFVSGYSGATIVTLTFSRNPSDPSHWSATGDKTYEDLKPIVENGGAIILRGDFDGDGISVSKSAYGYVVYTDEIFLYITNSLDTVMFSARPGEQLSGSTV